MTAPGAAAHDLVGLYGKIPSQGDFIRVNAADPAVQAFDQWLQEGMEVLQRAGGALPSHAMNFVFRTPSAPNVLIGTFAPSNDRVGRIFPLVVFVRVPTAAIAGRFSALPTAYDPFLQEAARLLADAGRSDLAQLNTRLKTLWVPSPADFVPVETVCRRTLDGTTGSSFQRRLFGDPMAGRQYFGLKTFVDACSTVYGRPPARAAITLECPISCDVDLFAWLELARRRLNWPASLPAFFWCEAPTPRLLVALGGAPPALLRYIARPGDTAAQLWPLTTVRPDAVNFARQGIAGTHRQAIDAAEAPLEFLLGALSR